jgi:acetyl esterase/lipase
MRHLRLLPLLALLSLLDSSAQAASSATPPAQPATGPGGAKATHKKVVARSYGSDPRGYWLFEPAEPAPPQAPVIVLNHGWGAIDPGVYRAWIDHLVQRGNIVIYPLYQDSLRTPPRDFTSNAGAAVTAALHRLQTEKGHVRPDLGKLALAGHSMGGVLSANLAALWQEAGLPKPRAVLSIEPATSLSQQSRHADILADVSRIPQDTLLVVVTGDGDTLAGSYEAKRIFDGATQVPLANKGFVTLRSDDHGSPALIADHRAPTAPEPGWNPSPLAAGSGKSSHPRLRRRLLERRAAEGPGAADAAASVRAVDALDFYGTWKLLDGLTDAAFFGTHRNYALGDTPEQRYMGAWSDGVPVRELLVTDHP